MRLLILASAALFALSACQKTNPPGEAPTGVTATEGDGLAVVSWDTLPDLTYWIFYQPGSTVDVATPNSIAIRRAFSPRVVAPLINGTQYAFVMNATHNDSAAGPNSLPVLAKPRLAGDSWTSGSPQPLGATPANLKGLAFNGSRFVAVGDATTSGTVTTPTILAGDFNYTNVDPPGVTVWMTPGSLPPVTPVSPPPGFTSNLSSVIFNGGAYVALGSDGSIISSTDGLTWTVPTASIPATGMNGLGFGLVVGVPTYIAVGNGGAIFATTDLNSPWVPLTSGTTSDLTSISVFPGSIIVTGAGGTLLSLNGSTWTPLTSNTTSTLRGVTFNAINGMFAAVGDAGTIITSTDGTTWTPVVPAPLAQDLRGVTTGGQAGTRFLAVGQGGAVVHSDDGLTWLTASSGTTNNVANNLAKVLFVPGMYLSVGDAGVNAVSK